MDTIIHDRLTKIEKRIEHYERLPVSTVPIYDINITSFFNPPVYVDKWVFAVYHNGDLAVRHTVWYARFVNISDQTIYNPFLYSFRRPANYDYPLNQYSKTVYSGWKPNTQNGMLFHPLFNSSIPLSTFVASGLWNFGSTVFSNTTFSGLSSLTSTIAGVSSGINFDGSVDCQLNPGSSFTNAAFWGMYLFAGSYGDYFSWSVVPPAPLSGGGSSFGTTWAILDNISISPPGFIGNSNWHIEADSGLVGESEQMAFNSGFDTIRMTANYLGNRLKPHFLDASKFPDWASLAW